jgi:hypothetical protein
MQEQDQRLADIVVREATYGSEGQQFPKFMGNPNVHPEAQKNQYLYQQYRIAPRIQWADNFIKAQKYKMGIQWKEKVRKALVKKGHYPVTVNRILPIVESGKSLLTYNAPGWSATAREDSDRGVAKAFADLFAHIWYVSDATGELKVSIDDYYVGGMGVLRLRQDPHADFGKGELFIENEYPLDCYFDPNSRDRFCRDSANILVVKDLTVEQGINSMPEYEFQIRKASPIENEYPVTDLGDTEGVAFLGEFQDTFHIRKRFIERYTKVRIVRNYLYEIETGREHLLEDAQLEEYKKEFAVWVQTDDGVRLVTDRDKVVPLLRINAETGGTFHMVSEFESDPNSGEMVRGQPKVKAGAEQGLPEEIPNSTTVLAPVAKGELIEQGQIIHRRIPVPRIKLYMSVGDEFLYERLMPCEDYPIVPLMNIHNRTPFPESDVRIFAPLQNYINKIRSLIIAHATTSTSPKVLLPRGAVSKKEIEDEWARAGAGVIEFDSEIGKPVVASPLPLPNELYKNEAEAKYDLEYGFGIHELMQGSVKNAPKTYHGTLAIDEYGQRRIKAKRDDIEGALNQLAKVAIPLIQQLYTQEKTIRLIQPNNPERQEKVNQPIFDKYTGEEIGKINDITTGKYDIIVVSGSMLPSNRWAQQQYYMELYEKKIIDQAEILKKVEMVNTEEVLARFSYQAQLEGMVQQLQTELKRVNGDMQTAQRTAVNALKRAELSDFASALEKIRVRTDASMQLSAERFGDAMKQAENQAVKPQA